MRTVLPKWLKADLQHRSLSSIERHAIMNYQMSKNFEERGVVVRGSSYITALWNISDPETGILL